MKKKKRIIQFIVGGIFFVFILAVGLYGILSRSDQIDTMIREKANASSSAQKVMETLQKLTPFVKTSDTERRLMNGDTKGLKVVFLTFDDGPSIYSDEVLDILKKYNVKATFFSVGSRDELAGKVWKRVINEGHTLANHSCSHNYDLYNTPDQFYDDVAIQKDFQERITGKPSSGLFRFPGGSATANQTCCRGIVERGYNYVDWNVSSGDATGESISPENIINNVVNGCAQYDVSVVLCHAEIKENTRLALPGMIETLLNQGYTFLPMKKEYTYPRQIEV